MEKIKNNLNRPTKDGNGKLIPDYLDFNTGKIIYDNVNHPKHYNNHPSGIECIQITEHMSFCLGNAIKYIWRADLKNDKIEDLKKAIWYINREIKSKKRNNK